jgi:ferric-dicitrate binding protein FerR (iron transport regulator)
VAPPPGGTIDFTVRSPSVTASVRGTVFDFDTVNISVEEGTVAFAGQDGRAAPVRAGEASFVDEVGGRTESSRETAAADLTPALPAGTESGAASIPVTVPPAMAEFSVDLNW